MATVTQRPCIVAEKLNEIETRFRKNVRTAGSDWSAAAYAEGARLLLKERFTHVTGCAQCLAAEREAA